MRPDLPRCGGFLQLKGLSGGLPRWRAAYDEALNRTVPQSERQNKSFIGVRSMYNYQYIVHFYGEGKEAYFKFHIIFGCGLKMRYLLQSEALTAFQTPGESIHLGHMMALLCQGLVQSACISVANGLVKYVCWLRPDRSKKKKKH